MVKSDREIGCGAHIACMYNGGLQVGKVRVSWSR